MDIYLSPVYIILAGLCIVLLFSNLEIPTAIIAILSGALVFYTVYLHVSMYSVEYRTMSTAAWVQNLGPTLLISAVVIMSVGYIIFFFKRDKVLNAYKEYLPEKETGGTSKASTVSSWNPFASSKAPAKSDVNSSVAKNTSTSSNLTKSQREEYISALDRLI
jgi:hypothetical protein